MDKRNDIEKCIITEAEKEEFNKRIMDWLSDENLEKAKGKTRQEIYSDFGNVLMPIAYIPIDYVSLLDAEIEDNRVYSGMGYFIDHAVNHHPNIAKEKYNNIQIVLRFPDEIKSVKDNGNDSIVFVKQIDRYNAVVLEVTKDNEDRIMLHKSFYDQKKKPYAQKGIRLYASSSEGGVSSIIRTERPAHGSSLPALEDDAKLDIFSEMQ